MAVIYNETLLKKFNFELLHAFNFSYTWNKEASSCRKSIVLFRHNIPYMGNSFVFSLDIPTMINILCEIIKILHQKMLNAIYLYWFHKYVLPVNNSLNGHSNKLWINGKRLVIRNEFISNYFLHDIYQPKLNFNSAKMTAMKKQQQCVSFRGNSCNQL